MPSRPKKIAVLTASLAVLWTACVHPVPPALWPSRRVAIVNALEVPICQISIGVDEPAPTIGPFVDYLAAPFADPKSVSLARRVPPNGEGTVLFPRPPKGRTVGRYELAIFSCMPDSTPGPLILRIGGVDPEAVTVRVISR